VFFIASDGFGEMHVRRLTGNAWCNAFAMINRQRHMGGMLYDDA